MLKIEDLKIFYGSILALKGVSLEVRSGSIVTILGANGAGKSTILRAISGIASVAEGSIRFLGERIDKLAAEKIPRLGLVQVPEGRALFTDLTVIENLRMGAYVRTDRKQIKDDMERVLTNFPRLRERSGLLASSLSGGEQQMLAISRALMAKPKLLLLDEPSLGLAPLLVEEIFNIIKKINQEGTTILLVEQNVNKALSLADYCYVLETGRIVLTGTGQQLKNDQMIVKSYLGG